MTQTGKRAGALALAVWQCWPVFCLRYEAREVWRALPGPWPVKVVIIVITQAIPGPQDELLLLAIVAVCRKVRARKARKAAARAASVAGNRAGAEVALLARAVR